MLNLMYITNDATVARIAESNGVNRIFVDLEYIGKNIRQGGLDTVQNHHTMADIKHVRQVLQCAELLVRCNPIHDKTEKYGSSKEEIDAIVENGADIIMLPYFKTTGEVKTFLSLVNGRTKTMLLFETPEAVDKVDEILTLDGIDEVYIGLNDLSLGYHKKFMFELLADGTVEKLCLKFRLKGIPYGFGGIASLGKGMLPSEYVIKEHYRLGSTCVILSRSFCNLSYITDFDQIMTIFTEGLQEIREYERLCVEQPDTWKKNHEDIDMIVKKIVEQV